MRTPSLYWNRRQMGSAITPEWTHQESPEELLVDKAQLLNADCSRNDGAGWRHARAEC